VSNKTQLVRHEMKLNSFSRYHNVLFSVLLLSTTKMFDYDVHFYLPELKYTHTIRKKELQERGVLLHLDCLMLTWQSHQLGTG
jgi:hypothetical protein